MGVFLKCELSTGHHTGYNQAQDSEVVLINLSLVVAS
jgi:hypothetical protein